MDDLTNEPAESAAGDVIDPPADVETDPDDPRPWIRDYVVVGAVQGDFGQRSAFSVVERVQRDGATDPADVAYLVHMAAETKGAEASIHRAAAAAAQLAERHGAARVVLDGTVSGASMLRKWNDAVERPREFKALRIGDREPPELGSTHRFPLVPVSRLDLLGAVRVAHDQVGGLLYTTRSLLARHALAEYRAKLPSLTPEEKEWQPPETWHVALAMSIGVWTLMELPPNVTAFGRRDLDWQASDRFRFDRRQLRDDTLRRQVEEAEAAAIRARGGIVMPNPREVMSRRKTPGGLREFARGGLREFVWLG